MKLLSQIWSAFVLLAVVPSVHGAEPVSAPSPLNVEKFLQWHWARPIPAQGTPPEHLDELSADLNPDSCGRCHVLQLRDWRGSRHARAMGPGIAGQLVVMPPGAAAEHQACLRCHAPLAEQAESLAAALAVRANGATGWDDAASPGLHGYGLVCAGCHVRGYRWYGPARRDGSSPPATGSDLPHGGWTVNPAFEDSRFCAACHQFEPDEYALNGKLLENTYMEWLASPYAEQGITCQSCHMPDRRHSWKGIHDKTMVQAGVTITASTPVIDGDQVLASLVIHNSGTGHYFPTYVTPAVVAQVYQEGVDGEELPGTRQEHVIARKVPLNLSKELFDTRIPPGGRAELRYVQPLTPGAITLGFRILVEPDAFYQDFFAVMLSGDRADDERALLSQALEETQSSSFYIYQKSLAIP